jgi:hypothetical protein
MLFLATLDGTHNVFLLPQAGIATLQQKKIAAVSYVLTINNVSMAFAERQVINGVKEVRFPHAVEPYEAVDLAVKHKVGLGDILVVEYVKAVKRHGLTLSLSIFMRFTALTDNSVVSPCSQ